MPDRSNRTLDSADHVRTGVIAAVLPLFLAAAAALSAQEPSAAAQSAIAGARVFGEQKCSVCHSVDGLGGGLGPDLRSLSSRKDAYGMTTSLWNHLPEMTLRMDSLSIPRPALSTREAGDLLAYLYMIGGGTGGGSAEAGSRLFRESGCIRCHRVGSAGGVIGPALDRIPYLRTPHGLAAGLWNHSGSMIPKMKEQNLEYPRLSASDLADLEAFLIASAPGEEHLSNADAWVLPGDPQRGKKVVERKGCLTCHRIGGRGAGTAPELAGRNQRQTEGAFLAALWNKGPMMRAAFAARGGEPPSFEPGEMADVSAYLQSIGYFASSGNSARGRRVIMLSGCLRCHGWGEEGARSGDLSTISPYPEMAARLAVLWNHARTLDPGETIPQDWPRLDRNEMIDLLEFLGAGSR